MIWQRDSCHRFSISDSNGFRLASQTPQRRWYQFSLRALLVVLTLTAAVLGGRIEYLRRSALFHEREAARFHELWLEPSSDLENLRLYLSHRDIAYEFRSAMSRPWNMVDETPRPLPNLPTPHPVLGPGTP